MSGRIKKFLCSFIFQPKKIQRPFKAFTFSPPGDFWGSSVKDESSVNEPVFYSTGKSLFLKCPPVIVYSETVLLREFANLLSRAGVGFRESRSLHFYSSRKKEVLTKEQAWFLVLDSKCVCSIFLGPFIGCCKAADIGFHAHDPSNTEIYDGFHFQRSQRI